MFKHNSKDYNKNALSNYTVKIIIVQGEMSLRGCGRKCDIGLKWVNL